MYLDVICVFEIVSSENTVIIYAVIFRGEGRKEDKGAKGIKSRKKDGGT
jgi:hypothetical protein